MTNIGLFIYSKNTYLHRTIKNKIHQSCRQGEYVQQGGRQRLHDQFLRGSRGAGLYTYLASVINASTFT